MKARNSSSTDARIYFGSPSSDTFTFIINNPMSYQEEPMEFKKSEVKGILINQPKPE